MAGTFSVIANPGQDSTVIFQNVHGRVPAIIVVRNVNEKNEDFLAQDENGTLLFAPSLRPGQAIAFSVPPTMATVFLYTPEPRFSIKADVQILA